MAFSASPLVHSHAAGLNSTITTPGIDTTGADLLIVSVSQYVGFSVGTLTDSKSNSWSGLTAQVGSSNIYTRLYYSIPTSVGSSHTFSFNNGGALAGAIDVQAWSGADPTPFDVENGAKGSGITSKQPGSITPNNANSLIISALGTDGGTGYSVNSSLTISDFDDYSGGNNEGQALAWFVQGAAAAINPTWSWSGSSTETAAVIAAFKPLAGGGGGNTVNLFTGLIGGRLIGGLVN